MYDNIRCYLCIVNEFMGFIGKEKKDEKCKIRLFVLLGRLKVMGLRIVFCVFWGLWCILFVFYRFFVCCYWYVGYVFKIGWNFVKFEGFIRIFRVILFDMECFMLIR